MVFEDQNERKAKQNYLREEVLNKGYNPEDFAEYLESKKQGGRHRLTKEETSTIGPFQSSSSWSNCSRERWTCQKRKASSRSKRSTCWMKMTRYTAKESTVSKEN